MMKTVKDMKAGDIAKVYFTSRPKSDHQELVILRTPFDDNKNPWFIILSPKRVSGYYYDGVSIKKELDTPLLSYLPYDERTDDNVV